MNESEIKIKRRDVLTVPQVVKMLRTMADQLEEGHTLTFEGVPITLANQVLCRRQYRKEAAEHLVELKLTWSDDLPSHSDLAGDPEEMEEYNGDTEDLDEDGVPTTPLDLPGPPVDRAELKD